MRIKKFFKSSKNLGFFLLCVGLGIVLCVILPLWGWVIIVGAGLIGAGWWLIEKSK